MKAWDDLEKAYRDGTSVKGRVIDRIKGGLRVDIDGIAAFLPGSQVDVRPVRNLDSLRNQIIEAKVIKLNRNGPTLCCRAKLLSSRRTLAEKIRRYSRSKKTSSSKARLRT
jgi:small subunit ribosomal protein S1